jgi:hypothetical protein
MGKEWGAENRDDFPFLSEISNLQSSLLQKTLQRDGKGTAHFSSE